MLGGAYEVCPECGSVMWSGRCENLDCRCYMRPVSEKDNEEKSADDVLYMIDPEDEYGELAELLGDKCIRIVSEFKMRSNS